MHPQPKVASYMMNSNHHFSPHLNFDRLSMLDSLNKDLLICERKKKFKSMYFLHNEENTDSLLPSYGKIYMKYS